MTTIRGALEYVIGALDPFRAASAGAVAVLNNVHDTVLHRNAVLDRVEPGVVTGGALRVDESTYALTVSDTARFHDGRMVLGEDVAASINALVLDPEKSGLLAGALGVIREAVATSARDVLVRTNGPVPLLDERLSVVRVLPVDWITNESGGVVLGAGPYRLVEVSSTHALLEPNEHYPGHQDRPRSVEFIAELDANARVDMLLAGHVNAIESVPTPRFDELSRSPGVELGVVPGSNMSWLMFNCSDPILSDSRVRRALSLAVDRAEIARVVHAGLVEPSSSLLSSKHPDRAPGEGVSYAPELASELLREAGLSAGFELDLHVSSASWVVAQLDSLTRHLARVGVVVRPTIAHTADLFRDQIPNGRYQALLSSGDPGVYGSDGEFLLRWYLTGTWARAYCHWTGPVVAEIEDLLARAVHAATSDERRALLWTVQRLAASHVPMTTLGHRSQPTAWSSTLLGFQPSPTTGLDFRLARVS